MTKSPSFPLDSYYKYLPEKLLDEARRIRETKALQLKERHKRKGYWVFNQEGDPPIEVEVIVGRKKIKSYSCDCQSFQDNNICAHIGAVIQTILDQIEIEHKQKKIIGSPRHLHTKTILQGVSENDLRSFVYHYASKHPHFALMFKAKFAHNVELENNINKYFSLCKRFASSLGQGALSSTRAIKLARYISDLLDLADDLLSEENFRETFHLVHGIMRFLVIRNAIYGESLLHPMFQATHEKLQALLRAEIAPKLRKEIHASFSDVIQFDRYQILDDLNLHTLLINFSLTETSKKKTIKELENYVGSEQNTDVATFSLIKIYGTLNQPAKIVALVEANRDRHSLVKKTLEWLNSSPSQQKIVFDLATSLYQKADGARLRNLSFDYLIKNGRNEKVRARYCIDYFLKERTLATYQVIKNILTTSMPLAFREISKQLKLENDLRALTMILGEEKKVHDLLYILQEERDIDLLMTNLRHLYLPCYAQTEKLFLDLYRAFLGAHIGKNSIDAISRTLSYLSRHQMPKLANSLKGMIAEEFNERTFLTKSIDSYY